MAALFTKLFNDEAGFIVSAELVLIATITVLGMVVGLSELATNVNNELEDLASAFGSMNQSFSYDGDQGHRGYRDGSYFEDHQDDCDNECDIFSTDPLPEMN